MNKSIRFGYHQYSYGYFIKLNIKIRDIDGEALNKKYGTIATIHNGKQGWRIEGTLKHDEISSFISALEMMKIDYNIEKQLNRKQEMLDMHLPKINLNLNEVTTW
jgi:hypothetical protein